MTTIHPMPVFDAAAVATAETVGQTAVRILGEQAERLCDAIPAAIAGSVEAREAFATGTAAPPLILAAQDKQEAARTILDVLAQRWPSDELNEARRLLARSADALDCAVVLGR